MLWDLVALDRRPEIPRITRWSNTLAHVVINTAIPRRAFRVQMFEVILNATSLFNHGNVRLRPAMDSVQRLVLVTPDMRCVHHSSDPRETNPNFGVLVPWWDRPLGTKRAQSA